MGDIGDMKPKILRKEKCFEISDLKYKIAEVDVRILNLQNQINRVEFEKETHIDNITRVEEEIKLIDETIKKEE